MRILTFVVLFLTTGLSFTIGRQFVEESGFILKKNGILIFILGLILSVSDYFLTILKNFSYAELYFFMKHFWFIILSAIFLMHMLINGKNFWYYFSTPVFFSVLLVVFFEVIIILFESRFGEYFVNDFVGWSSYFGVFGGIGAGLLLGCFKTWRNMCFSLKNIFKVFLHILFLGACALFPAFTIKIFIPPESFFSGCIVPIFVYSVSFIVFGEVMNFVRLIISGISERKTKEEAKCEE